MSFSLIAISEKNKHLTKSVCISSTKWRVSEGEEPAGPKEIKSSDWPNVWKWHFHLQLLFPDVVFGVLMDVRRLVGRFSSCLKWHNKCYWRKGNVGWSCKNTTNLRHQCLPHRAVEPQASWLVTQHHNTMTSNSPVRGEGKLFSPSNYCYCCSSTHSNLLSRPPLFTAHGSGVFCGFPEQRHTVASCLPRNLTFLIPAASLSRKNAGKSWIFKSQAAATSLLVVVIFGLFWARSLLVFKKNKKNRNILIHGQIFIGCVPGNELYFIQVASWTVMNSDWFWK